METAKKYLITAVIAIVAVYAFNWGMKKYQEMKQQA